MIIDGHHHIEAGWESIVARMDALGIARTVLVGVGVRDLNVVTIRDSVIFQSHMLFRTLGTWKARRLVASPALRNSLLAEPVNDRVIEAVGARPDRFLGFAFINPESPRALEEFRRCLDAGLCGLKLALLQYPTDLNGPRMRGLCELAAERRVPVFFHQGLTRKASDARCLVADFPSVLFIIAHAGVQYFDEAIALAAARENVFVDTSSYIVTVRKLRILHARLGASKLVFGTDVPVMSLDPSEGLDKIDRLPISGAEKERILGKNLLDILRPMESSRRG